MAALPNLPAKWSEEEYLAFERESQQKHELVNGEIFAMAGASWEHSLIVGNLTTVFNNALADKPCYVSPQDLRVKVSLFHSFRYPDVIVLCGEPKFSDDKFDTILNPTVIIEVLSPSTEKEDRGDKLREYRKIESVKEYLLISQESPIVERYLRQDAKNWLYTSVEGLDKHLDLPSLEIELTLADVYKKVSFDKPDEAT